LKKKLNKFIEKISGSLDVSTAFSSKFISFLLLALCLGVNIYVRLFPVHLPQFESRAVLEVTAEIATKISTQYAKEGGLSSAKINQKMQDEILNNPAEFNKKVEKKYQELKAPYQDAGGQTYLMELDPYYWAQYTEDVLQRGYPGTLRKDGKHYDDRMLAPKGHPIPYARVFPYFSAFLYKVASPIHPMPLSVFLFYLPVFYATCFLALLYFFMKRWSGDLPAFLTVFSMGLMGICVQRGGAGWYDSDMMVLTMALAVAWLLLEAVKRGQSKFKEIAFSCAAACVQGIFFVTWSGAWFMWAVAACFFIFSIAGLFTESCRDGADRKKRFLIYGVSAAIFFALSGLLMYVLVGVNIVQYILDFLKWQRLGVAWSSEGSIWPNALYTVSELGPLNLKAIASSFYAPWIFALCSLGLIFLCFAGWRKKRQDLGIFMLCWFAFMFAASFKANRFLLYLAVPLFVGLGAFLGSELPRKITHEGRGLNRLAGTAIFLFLVGFLIFKILTIGLASSEQVIPLMNDGWYKAMAQVEKKTAPNAIINSWWDNGTFFKYYGKRRVIFDGATQIQGALCYWMARALMEKDEKKALSILRMLNNDSSETFDRLLPYLRNPFVCERILEKLMAVNRAEGEKILSREKVPAAVARETLDALHAVPAPAFLIVEESMLAKMPSISFLGKWDFSKLFAYRNRNEPEPKVLSELREIFDLTEEKAMRVYEEGKSAGVDAAGQEALSQRELFYGTALKGKLSKNLLHFNNGLILDPKSKDVLWYSPSQGQFLIPKKNIFFENGQRKEVLRNDGDLDRTVVFNERKNEIQSLVSDDDLAESLLTRLFFLKGEGLKRFKIFYADEENKIYIYEILW